LDIGAQYKISDKLKVFANMYNLTDTRYQEFGGFTVSGEARYPMPSRSFIIGAEYTF
ncbi:MAG: TonB-dependent receptor, partial [Phascolarctobacterium sp.]|nr:TonB-dependent receptor [Phascolarctobacterium sp.]